MSTQSIAIASRRVTLPPLAWAALGVLAFSFTFPATVLAERGFDPYLVGAGRSVIAATIAAACLLSVRAPLPKRADLPGLIAVAVGCGIGFGLLSALALRHTTSTHAAVIVGLLPAATAIVAVLRTRIVSTACTSTCSDTTSSFRSRAASTQPEEDDGA